MKAPKDPNVEFDKYYYYRESVQSPDSDVAFFLKTFQEIKGKDPLSLREDFCAAFAISCEWVKLRDNFTAVSIDLSEEPLAYGKKNYLSQLTEDQQSRVTVFNRDVLDPELPKVDLVTASNFSYYIFKQRQQLKNYFANVYKTLNDGGLLIVDSFGGSQCGEPNEEETENEAGFSYFWDQDTFDPITNYAQFYIHFQIDGEAKREKAYSYDWRMWSIPEVREIMQEVGFKNTYVYWEADDEDGDGTGEYYKTEVGESCESWVAYIVGEK